MNLKKIINDSSKGCITDYEKIARLTTRMANLSMREIIDSVDNRTKNNIKTMADQIFKRYNLDKSVIEVLKFIDLLCMINETNESKISFQYVENTDIETLKTLISKMAFQYSCMDCLLEMLLNGAERNPLLQLYSYISAESLIDYALDDDYYDDIDCDCFQTSVEDTFLYRLLNDSIEYMPITITPETTIKNLLTEARSYTWRCWRPYLSIENYCVQMLKPYGVVNVLTVGCFQTIYWKDFRLTEILNKYYHYKHGIYYKEYQENYESYENKERR